MSKIKNSDRQNSIAIETIIKHSINNFKCAQKNGDNKQFDSNFTCTKSLLLENVSNNRQTNSTSCY